MHPGKRLSNGARVYLHVPNKYPMRTHDKVIEDGKNALTTGEAVNGVSPLSSSLNLVYSIPSEYMHSVVEGVTRMLLNFWFDTKNLEKHFILDVKCQISMQSLLSNVHHIRLVVLQEALHHTCIGKHLN